MDFTEVFKQTNNLVEFSPNGAYIATAVQQRLVVRESATLQIVQLYSCLDAIQAISWSPCSTLVLVSCPKLGMFQVWSLLDAEWTAKIDEGLLGLHKVIWSPDSRHLLSFSDYQLRITIWSLLGPNEETKYLQFPKYSDKGYGFRSDGKYFCLAERIQAKDYLSIFDTSDWSLQKRFPVETNDLHDLSWSPDGGFIACWDSYIYYNLLIYRPDGRLAGSFNEHDAGIENFMGIKSVEWSPSGQFLAVGSFDKQCRLLNHYTWRPLLTLDHPKQITQANIKFFKEVDLAEFQNSLGPGKSWSQSKPKLQYQVQETPCTIPSVRPDPVKPNPKIGVSVAHFNSTGDMLVTKNDSQPLILWVWDIAQCRQIGLIQQTSPIRKVMWNPLVPDQFAYSCGNGLVYLWEKGYGCDAIEVPAINFNVMDFKWNPDGKCLALLDKEKFCLSFIVDE